MSTPTALRDTSAADLIRAVDADIREDWSLFSGYDGFDTISEFRQVVDHFNQEGLDVEVVYAADGSGVIDMLGFGRHWSNDEIPGRGVYLDHYIEIKHCTADRSATGLDAAVGYLEVLLEYVHLLDQQVAALNKALSADEHEKTPTPSNTAAVKLCQDCTIRQENEAPDPAYTSNSTCESCHEAGVDCDHEGHAPEDFDSTPCAKCGSTLAGYRHHYAYWPEHDLLTPHSLRETQWRVDWEIDVTPEAAMSPVEAAQTVWEKIFGRTTATDGDACVFTVTDPAAQESVVVDLSEH